MDPAARGAGSHCTTPDGGAAVVTEYEPKRSFALASRRKGVLTTHRYTLRGSRSGTHLVLRLICDVNGRWWLGHSLTIFALWARDRRRLRRLKRSLERAA